MELAATEDRDDIARIRGRARDIAQKADGDQHEEALALVEQCNRKSASLGAARFLPSVKMVISSWHTDEFGNRYRTITAAD